MLKAESEGATTEELALLQQQLDFNSKLADQNVAYIDGLQIRLDMSQPLTEHQLKMIALLNEEHLLKLKLIQTDKDYTNQAIRGAASVISSSAAVLGVNKKNAKLAAKMKAIATGVNAFAAANSAMASASEVPVIGHILGPVAYISTLATGLAAATEAHNRASKMEQGGLIGGKRHSQGGTMINAEQGEFVMSRSAVSSIGVENLNRMNDGGGGSQNISININGGMISPEFVENELAEAVREASRRGADFGLS